MHRDTSLLDVFHSKFTLQDATLSSELLLSEPGLEEVDRQGPDLPGEFLLI